MTLSSEERPIDGVRARTFRRNIRAELPRGSRRARIVYGQIRRAIRIHLGVRIGPVSPVRSSRLTRIA
jgi:hypothetical protein